MDSIPAQVTLVDPEGFLVPLVEKSTDPEPDPTDPANWPAWTDNWFWEVSDPTEVAELEALALEAETDRYDAADSDSQWARMMAEHPAPLAPANQVSPDELAMAAAGLALG
jgi:hypothetical protein